MKTKKLGFTLIELIVVIAIIGVIAAIIIPFLLSLAKNPATRLIAILIIIAIIILIIASCLICNNIANKNTDKNPIIIIIALILLGILALVGFKNLKPHTIAGEIHNVAWEYKISIEAQEEVDRQGSYLPSDANLKYVSTDSNGDTVYYYTILKWCEVRSLNTQGFDKNPYWSEVNLQPGERRGPSTEIYSILIKGENNITEYFCDKKTWEKFYKGQMVEFEYRKLDNYIVKLHE